MSFRAAFWAVAWSIAFFTCSIWFGSGAAVAGVLCSAIVLAGRGEA